MYGLIAPVRKLYKPYSWSVYQSIRIGLVVSTVERLLYKTLGLGLKYNEGEQKWMCIHARIKT